MPRIGQAPRKMSLYRAITISVIALTLIAISSHGGLDRFAQEQVVQTTNQAVGIYVTSRAINGLVSVLQTAQLGPIVASAQVGQVLDPVNDAVERLSSSLVWAIGSLFFQRILLEVAASPALNWILYGLGAAMAGFALFMEWTRFRIASGRIFSVSESTLDRCRDWLVRAFVLAAIFRFIVPVFLALSFAVSQMFLESGIANNTEELSLLRSQASQVASSSSPDTETLQEERVQAETRIKEFEESMASAQEEIERLDERIVQFENQLEDEVGSIRRLLPESLGGVSDGEELQALNERRRELDREIETIEGNLREGEETLECIDTQLGGGSCDSLWDRISSAGAVGLSQLREKYEQLTEMATSITLLLVAVAIKTILFPILFLIGAVKCSVPVARYGSRLLAGFEEDANRLRETISHQTRFLGGAIGPNGTLNVCEVTCACGNPDGSGCWTAVSFEFLHSDCTYVTTASVRVSCPGDRIVGVVPCGWPMMG